MADLHGSLITVKQRNMGDFFKTGASIGARTLSLNDVSDFDEDGGSVNIAGTVYAYDSADPVADTIHLTTTLSAATSAGDEVDIWDPDVGVVVSEATALVAIEDAVGDPITAAVDYALAPLLAAATLTSGQSVSLTRDNSGYRVTAAHGKNNNILHRSNAAQGIQVGIDQYDGTVCGLNVTPGGTITWLTTLGSVRIKTPDGATYMPILASAFTVSSDAALKTRPTKPPDALAIIAAAPAKHWRYKTDEPGVKRVGPMADDLPEWLQQVDPEDGSLGLDLGRQSGLHHRAIEQLLARIEALEADVATLKEERR